MELTRLSDDVEIISRVYARVHGVERTDDWLMLKLHEEVGELTQAFLNLSGRSRDRGLSDDETRAAFRGEVADALAQLLLVARRFDVDLSEELERKWFRWRHLVRPEDTAGIRDVGDPVQARG
ncbi:pyrophosphatase [Promicromonospora iranensis]|uniref:NTP pyrophosphatase (Non-canonical NTP hydrolase) n=1 Tax=Promicromonospora iranensis TaxID=1105144 RepID=A0ABU2CMG9_9MICO|nr:pyrophosphatase [Promicromonospora iranensis]MDR7382539.1 NTP pyrophosphatase (non-canonical NTP hydrolase) [Promicromonospora iranensis]